MLRKRLFASWWTEAEWSEDKIQPPVAHAIVATQEAEIRRIAIQSQPEQKKFARSYFGKILHKNRACGVAQGKGREFKPQYHTHTKKYSPQGHAPSDLLPPAGAAPPKICVTCWGPNI
jgi:hypothetical protein